MKRSGLVRTARARRAYLMKKMFFVFLFISAAVYVVSVSAEVRSITATKDEVKKMSATKVVIETKFGNMTLKFFPDRAPGHVKNFLELAKSGFYDGTIFHRVIPGFMIQGGDPISKDPSRRAAYGTGGPGYNIKAEFNNTPHKRGILSMARTNDPNGAGSQFFICFDMKPEQQAMLDGKYTVFGEVVSGMEVADKIAALPQDPRTNNPNERVEIKMKVIEGKP
jgi:peptidyl-prolyl cis-trans isomerase B (cyclophilin B)